MKFPTWFTKSTNLRQKSAGGPPTDQANGSTQSARPFQHPRPPSTKITHEISTAREEQHPGAQNPQPWFAPWSRNARKLTQQVPSGSTQLAAPRAEQMSNIVAPGLLGPRWKLSSTGGPKKPTLTTTPAANKPVTKVGPPAKARGVPASVRR